MRISDWSSDVCSSDLLGIDNRLNPLVAAVLGGVAGRLVLPAGDGQQSVGVADLPMQARARKSVVEGKSVSVRVDRGGRRIIKKNIHVKTYMRTRESHKRRAHTLAQRSYQYSIQ